MDDEAAEREIAEWVREGGAARVLAEARRIAREERPDECEDVYSRIEDADLRSWYRRMGVRPATRKWSEVVSQIRPVRTNGLVDSTALIREDRDAR